MLRSLLRITLAVAALVVCAAALVRQPVAGAEGPLLVIGAHYDAFGETGDLPAPTTTRAVSRDCSSWRGCSHARRRQGRSS